MKKVFEAKMSKFVDEVVIYQITPLENNKY